MSVCKGSMSQPARAVWIEITYLQGFKKKLLSQPARAVWIEILQQEYAGTAARSQPARAVWIEIWVCFYIANSNLVTACEGCVD